MMPLNSLFFGFGLIFGSFLNVVIYRLRTHQGICFGGSFCPECKTKLKWYDLVPLLSFVVLLGHCRYCHKKISWQYPIVEVLSGLIWIGVFYKVFDFSPFGGSPVGGQFFPLSGIPHSGTIFSFFYYIFIFSAFLIIAVYDFKWQIIPDKIIYPTTAIVLVYNIFPLTRGDYGGFLSHLFTAVIASLFFFLIFYFSKGKAMGFGDVKLAFLLGLFLGSFVAFMAFVLAFVVGAIFGIILIVFGEKTLKHKIALGPFLIFGSTVAFFFFGAISSFLNFYY
ncbi:MAG: prepilin peptidase [Candidatus Azambacteria bacterium]|nr:prepilin peptidase [Candidatus Azambacteria bacterium]